MFFFNISFAVSKSWKHDILQLEWDDERSDINWNLGLLIPYSWHGNWWMKKQGRHGTLTITSSHLNHTQTKEIKVSKRWLLYVMSGMTNNHHLSYDITDEWTLPSMLWSFLIWTWKEVRFYTCVCIIMLATITTYPL